jgi:hypothetical protein
MRLTFSAQGEPPAKPRKPGKFQGGLPPVCTAFGHCKTSDFKYMPGRIVKNMLMSPVDLDPVCGVRYLIPATGAPEPLIAFFLIVFFLPGLFFSQCLKFLGIHNLKEFQGIYVFEVWVYMGHHIVMDAIHMPLLTGLITLYFIK